MSVLGVVIAGGRSSRFGSDKALALLDGQPLIAHALAALRPHVDALAVAGRALTGVIAIPDRPAPGLGPMGGLAGALRYAQDHGYDHVLSCGVDCLRFPAEALATPPCFLAAQPVIGLWPASAAAQAERFVAQDSRRSMRGFAEAIGATPVRVAVPPPNINTPADLAAWGGSADTAP
jgi:molybdenum cofactor guanylyltransferase